MNTSAAITDPLLPQASGQRARPSDPHGTVRTRIGSSGLRTPISRHGSAISRQTVINNVGRRMLKHSLFSPSQPRRLLHPATLSLPRKPCCPVKRRFPCSVLDTREAYLVTRETREKSGTSRKFHLRESRLSRTSSLSRSRFTNDETDLREHPE
jgi:hypothetical protein